jgi:putative endonuclease
MSFYVYIIKSRKDNTYYKGVSENYLQRLIAHNQGLSRYTKDKGPWDLIYVEEHPNKTAALSREKKLKRCKADYFEWLKNSDSNILIQT